MVVDHLLVFGVLMMVSCDLGIKIGVVLFGPCFKIGSVEHIFKIVQLLAGMEM